MQLECFGFVFTINKLAFQSHIGAIRISLTKTSLSPRQLRFNPTLVQLESAEQANQIKNAYSFNPTLVQLEFECLTARGVPAHRFNPTLVQLE